MFLYCNMKMVDIITIRLMFALYTVSQNTRQRLLIITHHNVDRFSNIFHWYIFWKKNPCVHIIKFTTHLKCLTTLPCERWKLEMLPISTASTTNYCHVEVYGNFVSNACRSVHVYLLYPLLLYYTPLYAFV